MRLHSAARISGRFLEFPHHFLLHVPFSSRIPRQLQKRSEGGTNALPCYQLHRVVPPECINEPGLGPTKVEKEGFGQWNKNRIVCPCGSERVRRRVSHRERSGSGQPAGDLIGACQPEILPTRCGRVGSRALGSTFYFNIYFQRLCQTYTSRVNL